MSAKDSTPAIPEYVSQADIDALLQGAGAAPTADAAPAEPQLTAAEGEADEVVISQADIDALLQGVGTVETSAAASAGPQEASAAGEADEVAISQADIDVLLQAAAAPEPKGEKGTPPGFDQAPASVDGDAGEEIFISQADIDALLQGVGTVETSAAASAGPQLTASAGEADEVTISQADIDALITSESAGGSQEIGLAPPGPSADQDAQTPAAAEAQLAALQKQPGGDRQKAEALLPSTPDRDGAASQKVILAASDGEQTPSAEAREDKSPAGGRWFFSKTLWTVAAVLLILMSTLTSFYLYKRQAPSRGAAGPQAFPISQTSATARGLDPSGAAGVALKGFVVPAAPDKKGVAGLIVDVELALFDPAGAAEIKKNEPYFRSLIFDLLFDALADLQHPEIDEPALMARIKTSLNRALPQENIRRVALENLRLL